MISGHMHLIACIMHTCMLARCLHATNMHAGIWCVHPAETCVSHAFMHQIFVTRMERTFGINSVSLGWITSYLIGRRQRVRYNGAISSWSLVDCGVPQGSILGPLFFLAYASDVFETAARHGLRIHGYADDLQIYEHCDIKDINVTVDRLSICISEIMDWMNRNRLKLNASKTEVILLGSSRRLINCTCDHINIDGNAIHFADKVRNLGVILDSALTFNEHVTKLVNSSYYHLRQMRSIRKSLTFDSSHALARALILSRLDYCNGLLSGIPVLLMKQLDGVMRAAARLILQLPRSGHVTKAMHDRLHWLDMQARIEFKLCVTAYRCLHGLAPSYLSWLCIPVSEFPGRSVALTYALQRQVNFWFPPAKRKQLNQGLLQLPAQLLGTICQSKFRIQPTVTVSQLSKRNWKHIFFHANVNQILTFIFIHFIIYFLDGATDTCSENVSFKEHANTWIIIIIIMHLSGHADAFRQRQFAQPDDSRQHYVHIASGHARFFERESIRRVQWVQSRFGLEFLPTSCDFLQRWRGWVED